MPTLDRRLLAWSDSDTDDDGTPTTGRDVVVDEAMYDRRGGEASVDDVLVPGVNGARAGKAPADGQCHRGVYATLSSGNRKACCAAAGLVAVGCLSAYLAWRCRWS